MKSGWIYYMPIHLPRLLITIVNDCSWSNNLCIMAVDKWSIEIYIVQKIIPLNWKVYDHDRHTWIMDLIPNSWGELIIHDRHYLCKGIYSPYKRKSFIYVSHGIIIISIVILREACTHWEWNYDILQCGWGLLSHKFIYEST